MLQDIIDFNHISKDLTEDERTFLMNLYKHYQLTMYVYRKAYRKYNKINIIVSTISGLLSGTSLLAFLPPPFSLASISAVSALILNAIRNACDIEKKLAQYKTAFQYYVKVLNNLKISLRGMPYNRNEIIARLDVIDNIIAGYGIVNEEPYKKDIIKSINK